DYPGIIEGKLSTDGNTISATATKGADASAFDAWTWVAATNSL
ncbi:MAG: hypothetical protein ACI956_002174, partial [Nonlabens sp.]